MESTPSISLFIAFSAGLFSFLSPCILPLIPSYISFITGISFESFSSAEERSKLRRTTVVHSLLFIFGFSLVFVLLGASATYAGQLLQKYQFLLAKIGGVIIIILGIHLTGIINLKFLQREKKVHLREKPLGYLGTVLVGMTFAAGWTPCIGPILGSILIVASTSQKVTSGIILLSFYSLGLALPFFASSLAINSFLGYFKKIRPYLRLIPIISGILLIGVGVLLVTDYFTYLVSLLIRLFPPPA